MGQPRRLLPQMQRLEARQAETETDREATTAVQPAKAHMTNTFFSSIVTDPAAVTISPSVGERLRWVAAK
jgi:hypothetical protein